MGIDIGGTNTVVGLCDEDGKILISEAFPTAAGRSAQLLFDDIKRATERIMQKLGISYEKISAAGVACPGIISNGVCKYANNLCFVEVPLKSIAETTLNIPSIICNDANAAAFGEHIAGCGKGKSSLAMLTIGTGIGGGIVIDNKIWSGFDGLGGELGHFIIREGGKRCSCGSQGCIEAYCSATALIKATREKMQEHPESALWKLAKTPEEVNGTTAFRAADDGDETARRVLDSFFRYLSVGIQNIIVLLQPEIVCIGGGMSREGEKLLAPVRKRVNKNALANLIGRNTEIVAASLFGDAGLIGAAALAQTICKR